MWISCGFSFFFFFLVENKKYLLAHWMCCCWTQQKHYFNSHVKKKTKRNKTPNHSTKYDCVWGYHIDPLRQSSSSYYDDRKKANSDFNIAQMALDHSIFTVFFPVLTFFVSFRLDSYLKWSDNHGYFIIFGTTIHNTQQDGKIGLFSMMMWVKLF